MFERGNLGKSNVFFLYSSFPCNKAQRLRNECVIAIFCDFSVGLVALVFRVASAYHCNVSQVWKENYATPVKKISYTSGISRLYCRKEQLPLLVLCL